MVALPLNTVKLQENLLTREPPKDDCAGACHGHSHNSSSDLNILKHSLYALPFLGIFILRVATEHANGLLITLGLFVHVFYMNMNFRSVFYDNTSKVYLFFVALVGLLSVALLHYLLRHEGFYRVLFCFTPFVPLTDWLQALWCIVVVDYTLKTVSIFIKSVLVLPPKVPLARKGTILAAVEYICISYRCFPPILPWILFLTEATAPSARSNLFLRIVFGILYMVAKLISMFIVGRSVWRFFVELKRAPLRKAVTIFSREEVICPICHQKASGSLYLLPCQHSLCSLCGGRWLNFSTECPVCHSKLSGSTKWRDGTTDIFCRLY